MAKKFRFYYIINADGTVAQKTTTPPSAKFARRVTVVPSNEDLALASVMWDGKAFVGRERPAKGAAAAERSALLQELRDALERVEDPAARVALQRLVQLTGLA